MKTWKEILRFRAEDSDPEDPCRDDWELPRWVDIATGKHRRIPDITDSLAPYLADLWRLQGQAERLELLMPSKRDRIRHDFNQAVRSVHDAANRELTRLEASE